MPHLERLAVPLLAAAALIAAAALLAAPASAQTEGVKVFVIGNDMVNDAERDERWQMRVTARPVGGCTPTKGDLEYSSPWIDTGAEVAAELSLGECVFAISVAMRQASSPENCWYTAQLRWGELTDQRIPTDDYVYTSDRPDGVSRISAVRNPNRHCALPPGIGFYVNGEELVDDLPGPSADAELLVLAERAAEIAAFEVRLEPDRSAGSVPAGCDRTGTLTVRGDGQRVRHPLETLGGSCRFNASITRADAPFEPVQDRTVAFSGDARVVELSLLARLPQARIAIIQNVRGSANQGAASYTISRSCGDRQIASPAAARRSTPLQDGRYTVHAPHVPSFGATAIYPAVAAAADAQTIVGCSVTVSVSGLPAGCVVDGGSTRTLTWSKTQSTRQFDFEFEIGCGSGTSTGATSSTPTDAAATEDAPGTMEEPEPQPDPATTAQEPRGGPKFDAPTG